MMSVFATKFTLSNVVLTREISTTYNSISPNFHSRRADVKMPVLGFLNEAADGWVGGTSAELVHFLQFFHNRQELIVKRKLIM